ncbi:MAG: hypothetical protein ACLFTI_08790 [Anaerolineales bacterium]
MSGTETGAEIEQHSDTSKGLEIVDADDAVPVHKTETIEVIDVTPPANRPSRFANAVAQGLTLLSQAMRLAIDILETRKTKRTQPIEPPESRRAPVSPVTSTRDQPVQLDVAPSSRVSRGGGRQRRQRSGRGRHRH